MSEDGDKDEGEREEPVNGSDDNGGDEPDREPTPDLNDPADDTPVAPVEPLPPSLAETMLHANVAQDDLPGKRWAYPSWRIALVSLFVLFHAVVLLVHNLPSKGLSRNLHKKFNDGFAKKIFDDPADKNSGFTLKIPGMRKYMRATGNTQSWAMFAPNPHRSNIFMKVMVKDANGDVYDLKHDIWKVDRYPYLFYDRMGKINRRIIDQKGYRRHYAAWVCREWERKHNGEAAEEVQYVKMWTRIPTPREVFRRAKGNLLRMTYDPWSLHLHQREEDTIRCSTTRHAQLPDYLRERYGFPQNEKDRFRPVHIRTWWDKKEAAEKAKDREGTASARRPGQVVSDVAAVKREDAP